MGLHLGLQDMSELMASLLTTVLAEVYVFDDRVLGHFKYVTQSDRLYRTT